MGDKRLFWADRIAEQIIFQVNHNPSLNELVKKNGFIIYDEKTPSGQIHIGSGRGWVIHDTIAKALRDNGENAQFILSNDDIDPMDALPNLKNKNYWKQFMGRPFRDIPSPVDGYKSYGDYFFKEATDKFDEYGLEAKFESTGQRYENGDFNPTIKLALDNTEKIQEIFSRFYEINVMQDKLPFNPKCEQCGKIGTTRAFEWNKDTEKIKYICKVNQVTWAEGCGFKGEISPYNGNGKLPWKIEWAAKWPTVGVLYETAGKDHFSSGGSRDVSIAISNEIFNYLPPLPSTVKKNKAGTGYVYKKGEAYEFFLIGGAKMSSSKGQGFPFSEMTAYAPGNILKYILVRKRPKTSIDFDPQLHLESTYGDYDETERLYYESIENPDLLKKDKHFNAKRLYELAHVGKIQKIRPQNVEFNFGLMIVQLTKSTAEAIKLLKQKSKLQETLSESDFNNIEKRLDFFRTWLSNLAPEDKIISLRLPTNLKLTEEEIRMVKDFNQIVKEIEGEKELLKSIKKLISIYDIDIKEFYNMIYSILFAKPKGPRLIPYIVFSGKETINNHLDSFLLSINL